MKKILAIDDQKDNLTTIKAVLKNQIPNCQVLTALSGKEGIEIAKSEFPDTILLDIIMPEMDGYEVCKILKENELTKHIPIILITAIQTDSENRVKGLNLGADAFLSKPIDAIELSAQVNVMLRIKEAEDKLREEKEVLEETVLERTKEIRVKNEDLHKFEHIVSSSTDMMALLDVNFTYKAANKAYKDAFNLSSDQLIGNTIIDIFGENFFINVIKPYAIKCLAGEEVNYQDWFEFPENRRMYMDINYYPYYTKNKKIGGFVVSGRDITKRKKAELALAESELHYRELFENSPVPMWEEDFSEVKKKINELKKKGVKNYREYFKDRPKLVAELANNIKIIDVNQSVLRLHEAKTKDELLKGLSAIFTSESHKSLIEEIIAIAEGKTKCQFEGLVKTLKGKEIHLQLNWVVVPGYEETLERVYVSTLDITERKQAEQSLIDSEYLLRKSQETAALGSYVLDIESGIWSSSSILNYVFGIDEDFIKSNESWLNIVHLEDRKMMQDYFVNNVLKNHEPFDKEYRIKRINDQVECWVHGMGKLEFDDNGKLIRMIGTIQNITERKLAEIKLKESEERFRQIIENSQEWVWEVDAKGLFTYSSPIVEILLGYKPNEIVGKKHFYDLFIPEERSKLKKAVQEVFKNKQPFYDFINRNLSKEGKEVWLSTSGIPILDDSGKLLGYRGVDVNITQRKLAEQALAEQKERFANIIEGTNAGTWDWNIQTGELVLNERWAEIIGFSLKDLSPININTWSDNVHPEDLTIANKMLEKHFNKETDHYDVEFRQSHKNGSWVWINARGKVIEWSKNGKPLRISGTHLDITDNKRTEQVQKILFNISNTVNTTDNLVTLISQVQKELGTLIDTTNFYIALYDHKTDTISLPFMADEKDDFKIFPAGKTLTYYVIKTRKSLLATPNKLRELEELGEIESFGSETKIWLGVPLKIEGTVTGVLAVQSYSNEDAFTNSDMEILEFVADQVSISIDRKKAEELISKSQERFDLAMQAAKDGLYDWDLVTNKIYYSSRWKEILGYSQDELENDIKIWEELTHKEERDNSLLKLEKAIKNKIINYDVEFRMKHKKGHWVDILSKSQIIYNKENVAVRIVGIHSDITERKKSESIQKTIYNISNAIISLDNIDNLINFIQKELGNIMDTKNFYIAFYDSKTDSFSSPYFSDEKDDIETWPAGNSLSSMIVRKRKSILLNKKTILELSTKGELDVVGAIPEVWMGSPLFIDGEPIGIFAVQSYDDPDAYNESDKQILDFISDQISLSLYKKKSEEDLKIALEKAKESDRLKSAFLATMSHELRTPLNAIIGFSDIINDELSIEEVVEFNKTINSSGKHLLSIVEDLFDITLIETGEIKIVAEETNLKVLLNEVSDIINIEQKKSNKENLDIDLVIPSKGDNIILHTDASKLKQILLNLLKNALKFTNQGHIKYGFKFETINNIPMLKFYVEDSGIGIPKSKHKFIFDIFRQVEDTHTRNYGGTGIGLSISKRLTEILGGEIGLISTEGKGSTFFFTIPYITTIGSSTKKSLANKLTLSTDESKEVRTILVVEDIESSYEYLQIILKKSGFKTIWAKNGEESIKCCQENSDIDLVLMDINMPIMNGFDATRALKLKMPNLPIIAQTAYAISGDREKALAVGCDDYISKPINREKLIQKIDLLLNKVVLQ